MTKDTRKRITLERFYRASIQDVWDLWTTKAGIESWWGPGGFAVTARTLDLRPGGELLYAMTAIDPPQVEFMKKAGMPVTQECRITFAEIVPLKAPWVQVMLGQAPLDWPSLLVRLTRTVLVLPAPASSKMPSLSASRSRT